MTASSPLQIIYQGSFPEIRSVSPEPWSPSPRVEEVVEACRLLARQFPPDTLEMMGSLPREMLQGMAEIGLFGLSLPAAYGGLGFTLRECLKVVEEMVRLDMAAALPSLAHLSIGVKGIELFGNEPQKHKYLVPAASGQMIFGYALTEPKTGSDAQHIETHAEISEDGRGYVLNGQKTYITNANYAGAFTLFAQMDKARPGYMGAFIVESSWPGVKIGKDMPKMGLKASSTAAIQLRDVQVPVENLLGAPGEGFRIAMTVINYGRLALGAASLGMMRQSLADMKKRSASRLQFGAPIGSFPLIREKLVKAEMNALVTEAMTDFTAAILERDPRANVAIETSHTKLFGTTRAWETLYDAFQVAGGAAYLATNPYEKRMRDFRVATVFEGTTEIHSFYPALSILRGLLKQNGPVRQRLPALLRSWCFDFKRRSWPLDFRNRTLKRASWLSRATANTIRRLLHAGFLVYGKAVLEKQFFLRRITTLSLYLYGLLTVMAKLAPEDRDGEPDSDDLSLLECFMEEAKERKRSQGRLFDSRKERLYGAITAALYERKR